MPGSGSRTAVRHAESAADFIEVMLVGEQPGDQEEKAGHPFVGSSGKVLDAALTAAGIDRDAVYVTNAVKHFKYERARAEKVFFADIRAVAKLIARRAD